MASRTVNFRLREDLAKRLDKAAKGGRSKSSVFHRGLELALQEIEVPKVKVGAK